MRRLFWLLGLVPILMAGCKPNPPAAAPPGPPEVKVTTPIIENVTDFEYFTGHTEAYKKVDIRARVTGYLEKINFKDGDIVKEDSILFVIDQKPAKAALAKAEADLKQAKAHRKRLEADFARAQALLPRGGISQEDFDLARGNRDEAIEAVGSADANVDIAKQNLQYTEVRAPITGRISRRLIDKGNLVKQDDTILTTIVTLDPIYAYFDVDERTVLRQLMSKGALDTARGGKVKIDIGLADEQGYPHVGIVDFVDNTIDINTGTMWMRAEFGDHNSSKTTREVTPGMYIRVRFPVGHPYLAPRIPEQAIATDQGQKFVYVLDKNNKAEYRQVTIGRLENGLRVIKGETFAYTVDAKDPSKYQLVSEEKLKNGPNVIKSDIKPDERIVVSGLQRIKSGMEVKPLKMEAMPEK
jgi:RND family efflux transporter MFP subunit